MGRVPPLPPSSQWRGPITPAARRARASCGPHLSRYRSFRAFRRGAQPSGFARIFPRPVGAVTCKAAAAASTARRPTAARALRSASPADNAVRITSAACARPRQVGGLPGKRIQHGSRGIAIVGERAQHVEAHHVARALPDRIDRRLAIKPRHDALLDVAIAAEALHRFVDETGRGLADPILHRRREQARPRRLPRVAAGEVERAGRAASPARRRPRPRSPCRPAPPASSADRTRCFWNTLRWRA